MIELLKYEWYNFKKSPTRKVACCLILLFFVSFVFVSNAVEARDLKKTTTSKLEEIMYYPRKLDMVQNELQLLKMSQETDLQKIKQLETEYIKLGNVNNALTLLYSDYKHSIDGCFNIERYTAYLDAKIDALKSDVLLFGDEQSIQKNELEVEVALKHESEKLPYYLSSYHLQVSNYIGSVLTGFPVLLLLLLVNMMNYESFSSEFNGGSFKTTYSIEHSRESIVHSKLLFSIVSSVFTIILGIGLGMITTWIINGFGSFSEEIVVLAGYQSFIQPAISYKIITSFTRNFQTFIFFSVMLIVYLMIIHLIAIKSKSKSTTFSLALAILLIVGIVGEQSISDKISIIFGLASYSYSEFLSVPKLIGIYAPILNNLAVSFLIYLWMRIRFVKEDL